MSLECTNKMPKTKLNQNITAMCTANRYSLPILNGGLCVRLYIQNCKHSCFLKTCQTFASCTTDDCQ